MLDIHTVGAGGGSIARFDVGGALRVGPESAGSDPGPICYGRGTQPTVTDANLLLGRLRPDRFLGGEFLLDMERTRAVVQEWLQQQQVKLKLEQFADGVLRVVNANMERALRVVSIERGHDPRDFALVAFGGAGGLHACELASSLGIPQVIIPAIPGALSAFGILASDIVKDYSQTLIWNLAPHPNAGPARIAPKIRQQLTILEQRARRDFREEAWSGKLLFEHSADLRYQGQGFELNVPVSDSLVTEFHHQHQARYGYSHPDRNVELVTLRLRVRMKSEQAGAISTPSHAHSITSGKARVFFAGRPTATSIYAREALLTGRKFRGPAIITEYSATTVIPPNTRFGLDSAGNLRVHLAPKRKSAQKGAR
jgi:N-methylhydantoinase A